MTLVDVGTGTPVVLIPGVQGRWEWMRRAVDALATGARVLTFSLADEPTAHAAFDPEHGFNSYVEQVRLALDQKGLSRAVICGVSYGGLVAATFAARHPDRTSALVLVSAIPPDWSPDARIRFYLRAPRLLVPLFMLASLRLFAEILSAAGSPQRAIQQGVRQAWTVLTHMFSPFRMARRARLIDGMALTEEVALVAAPTLIVVGEEGRDRVVPVARTLEYATLIPHARTVTISRSGHLGCMTRPDVFAALVLSFVREHAGTSAQGDHRG